MILIFQDLIPNILRKRDAFLCPIFPSLVPAEWLGFNTKKTETEDFFVSGKGLTRIEQIELTQVQPTVIVRRPVHEIR